MIFYISGTVVDYICHPNEFGFYLCSQIGTKVNFLYPNKFICVCVCANCQLIVPILLGNDSACALSNTVG
jgi:hypothetical protein